METTDSISAVVVVPGDARGRGQQHSDHGRLADHAYRAFAELSRRAMGGQCLSGRRCGLHCARRRDGGPVWRTAGIDGRIGAVRRCVLRHCPCQHTNCAAGGTGLARPWRSDRGAQHSGCGRHQCRARAQGSSDRRLDRVPDAWLQHRAAARRRAHSRHRLARDLLAQRRAHVNRHRRSGLRRLGDRACCRHAKPARGLDRLCFAGHVDGVAGLRAACTAACGGGTAPRCRPVRTRGDRVLPAADRGVACRGAAGRPELLRAARVRHGRGHRLAVDVQHHEPAALLQSLCAEPGRTRPHRAAGGRLAPAAERGAACARLSQLPPWQHGSGCAPP